jgi:hypothetical protein
LVLRSRRIVDLRKLEHELSHVLEYELTF